MIWTRIFRPILISGCLLLLTAPSTRAQNLNDLQLDATSLFEFRGPREPTIRIGLAESAICATNRETQDLLCDGQSDLDQQMAWHLDELDLCRADTAIVRSLRRCEYAGLQDIDLLSGLMNNLAQRWRLRGDSDRARELFRSAASLLERVGPKSSLRSFVLGNWATSELQQGNLGVAAIIANRWVDASRA